MTQMDNLCGFLAGRLMQGMTGIAWALGRDSRSETRFHRVIATRCRILRDLAFSNQELEELSQAIDTSARSKIATNVYPLPFNSIGERFPTFDPMRKVSLPDGNTSRLDLLHAILESIAKLEADGYYRLAQLGAEPLVPTRVFASGGGARNPALRRMRERNLPGAAFTHSASYEASVGAARLACGALSIA